MQTKNGQNIKTNLFSRQLPVYGNVGRDSDNVRIAIRGSDGNDRLTTALKEIWNTIGNDVVKR